jgi:hypothetical protein
MVLKFIKFMEIIITRFLNLLSEGILFPNSCLVNRLAKLLLLGVASRYACNFRLPAVCLPLYLSKHYSDKYGRRPVNNDVAGRYAEPGRRTMLTYYEKVAPHLNEPPYLPGGRQVRDPYVQWCERLILSANAGRTVYSIVRWLFFILLILYKLI